MWFCGLSSSNNTAMYSVPENLGGSILILLLKSPVQRLINQLAILLLNNGGDHCVWLALLLLVFCLAPFDVVLRSQMIVKELHSKLSCSYKQED